jgi:hypothetical protein
MCRFERPAPDAASGVGKAMSRVIAVVVCGFALAACSVSMPSLDFFRSTSPSEVLRVESEPPGADARTTQGEACRTPCELTVPSGGELAVSFALNGYQPMTVPVRAESAGRLQPNPVYAELQPLTPPRPGKKSPAAAKKRPVAKAGSPSTAQGQATAPEPAVVSPGGYPWPSPPSQ